MSSFSTGVTSTKPPSGSRRRMVENSRTIAGRPIGLPSWNQVPSRAIRISLSPQWVGCHFSTGGSLLLLGQPGDVGEARGRLRSSIGAM